MKKYSIYDTDKINWAKSDAKAILIPAIAILSIIFLGLTWRLHSHWSSHNRWVPATAKVVKSYITNECATSNPSGGDTTYGQSEEQWDQSCQRVEAPHIRYAYEVEGKRYASERISLQAPAAGAPGEWKAWVEARRTGKNIDIWYDPEDPEEAVIDKSWNAAADVLTVLFCGLLLAGAVWGWRVAQRRLA
ncbi:MAG: DUF3592 domain-containing protein [Alphaproteobacteria bacterium]|nr:MAG: DUF3592 domain-containing protein [Alphaproteobacteria bacterium]